MISLLGIANKVRIHLVYTIQWSNVCTIAIPNSDREVDQQADVIYLLKGHNPKSGTEEYVLPVNKRFKVTLHDLNHIFGNIEMKYGGTVDKIVIAVADNDGTILCYYVHKGVKNFTD